jgi:hypothetical protein
VLLNLKFPQGLKNGSRIKVDDHKTELKAVF